MSKLTLSPFETELVQNAGWILTKNGIMQKLQLLLGEVQQNISDYTLQHPDIFPAEAKTTSPKISRGENYLGLPWMMLDYPRHFEKENFFAIRIMFWWGNYFSTTLHISGRYKERLTPPLLARYEDLSNNNFYICIHDDQWHHELDEKNYTAIAGMDRRDFEKYLRANEFIKLASKTELKNWDVAVSELSAGYAKLAGWLVS
jgi:hypothetical protein